jgi:hypothetical protein
VDALGILKRETALPKLLPCASKKDSKDKEERVDILASKKKGCCFTILKVGLSLGIACRNFLIKSAKSISQVETLRAKQGNTTYLWKIRIGGQEILSLLLIYSHIPAA